MVRNTKTAERAAMMKKRRSIRRKLRAKQAGKRSVKRVTKTHPHRSSSSIATRR